MDEMVAILDSLHHLVSTVPANEIVEVPGSEPFHLVKHKICRITFG